jgi:hypothetical protein
MEKRKEPLSCRIEDGKLIIQVGVDTLAFAAENIPKLITEGGEPSVKIIDSRIFARDVLIELERDDASSSPSLLERMLDEAIFAACENGSMGVVDI